MMDRERAHGAAVDLSAWAGLPLRALLFGEAQGRIVVSSPDAARVIAIADRHGVSAHRIGTVTAAAEPFRIDLADGVLVAPVERLAAAYHDAIPALMSRVATASDDEEQVTEHASH
jgi:phosphoribosylformylglycinamidine synthase